MKNGWICLHRCIKKHWIWQDANRFKWWVDLLLRANHEDKKVLIESTLVECKRGQFVTSLCALAKEWGVSRDVVRHFLDLLESDTMVIRKATTKYTQITICNYDSYQSVPTTNTTTETTTETTTDPQLTHTINNDNNIFSTTDRSIENKNNTISSGGKSSRFIAPTVEEVKAYCEERGNGIDAEYFVNYYEKIGWVCGKNKAKMKNWKSAVHTWEKMEKSKKAAPKLGPDEWMDGERRTYGTGEITIPLDAPARPSSRHAWSKANGKWILT